MTDENLPPVPPEPSAAPVPPAPSAASVPPAAPGATPYVAPTGVKQTLSLVSFILGIAGLVFSWVFVLGFLASVAAIVLGFLGKKREPNAPRWMWLVGIILGFVAVAISLIVIVFTIIGFALLASSGSYYSN